MENLPSLVLSKIIICFNLKERTKLREICRNWKYEIDKFNQTTLCVHEDPFPFNLSFSFTNKLVGHHNSTSSLNRKFFKYSFLFDRIRRLYVSSVLSDLGISLDKLNHFKSVEQLEIFGDLEFDKAIKFNFKKLRILSLKRCKFDCGLELDCPKLDTFICWRSIEQIKFNHPLSLKYSELLDYESSIKQFSNLEILVFLSFKTTDLTIRNDLTRLKELHLNVSNYIYMDLEAFDSMKLNLEKNHDLKVAVTFFKFETNRYESDRFKLNKSSIRIMKNNYQKRHQVCNSWPFEVDYSSLINTFGSIPTDFFDKFPNIEIVLVEELANKKIDELHLIEFLKNCKQLRGLHFDESLVGELFYDNLVSLLTLEQLNINKLKWCIHNYKFLNLYLNQLKNLKKLQISFLNHNYLSTQLVYNVLNRCNQIDELSIFKHSLTFNDGFVIKKTQSIYSLTYSKIKMEIIFSNLDNLIKHLVPKQH